MKVNFLKILLNFLLNIVEFTDISICIVIQKHLDGKLCGAMEFIKKKYLKKSIFCIKLHICIKMLILNNRVNVVVVFVVVVSDASCSGLL